MKSKFCLISVLLLCMWLPSAAQYYSRSNIKKKISEWGHCRNVAITMKGWSVALNGINDYVTVGIPDSIEKELAELKEKGEYIDDIQITEVGSWLILYGDNGLVYRGVSEDLEKEVLAYHDDNEVINTVAFNDLGDWIIISRDHYSVSSTVLSDEIDTGMKEYGNLVSAHMNNEGILLCFETGYKVLGKAPESFLKRLRVTTIDAYRVKFLPDGTYFIADKDGNYDYYM